MILKDIKELLQAEVISGEDSLDLEIMFAGGSDLMSDVLAFGKPGILLLTGLSNAQSVRTANIIDAKAIVYVRGKKPDDEGITLAKEKGIPLLSTKLMMYTACGLLFSHGLPGVSGLSFKK
jgi:predicted transcriptional regulator